MKARTRTDAYGNITIYMEGGLDYQNNLFLKDRLEKIASENPFATIILDLYRLDFVGSSGIGLFVETIKNINKERNQIRVSNAKNEFVKVFKLFGLNMDDILIDELESEKMKLSEKSANFSK